MSIQRKNLAGLAIVLAVLMAAGTLVGLTSVQAQSNSPGSCTYDLSASSAQTGTARVKIVGQSIEVEFENTTASRLYTIWIDYKNRASGLLAPDYPDPDANPSLDLRFSGSGIARGVAPAFATTQGVTSGMGLDANGMITDDGGKGNLTVELDYNLLLPGASPVVAADLVGQDDNRVGGGWLRLYQSPVTSASAQVIDAATGLPVVIRATAQGITIVKHPDNISHGHTPGVGGVDHLSAFKGDFPAECLGP